MEAGPFYTAAEDTVDEILRDVVSPFTQQVGLLSNLQPLKKAKPR